MSYIRKTSAKRYVRCCKCRAETEEWMMKPTRRGPACLLCIIRHAVRRGEPLTLDAKVARHGRAAGKG